MWTKETWYSLLLNKICLDICTDFHIEHIPVLVIPPCYQQLLFYTCSIQSMWWLTLKCISTTPTCDFKVGQNLDKVLGCDIYEKNLLWDYYKHPVTNDSIIDYIYVHILGKWTRLTKLSIYSSHKNFSSFKTLICAGKSNFFRRGGYR